MGKTTTAINLGTSLAAIGKEVLLIDLDPQGNASTGLGISVEERRYTTYEVVLGAKKIEEILYLRAKTFKRSKQKTSLLPDISEDFRLLLDNFQAIWTSRLHLKRTIKNENLFMYRFFSRIKTGFRISGIN